MTSSSNLSNLLAVAGSGASLEGSIPVIVLVAYAALLVFLSVIALIKSRATEEDYYLAGRQQGYITTSLTLMATYFSGVAILVFPGLVYEYGIAPMFLALNLPVAGAAIFILGNRIRKLGKRHGFVTPGDMVSAHYNGSSVLRILVALLGFCYVIPYVVIQIEAGGHIARTMFPDADSDAAFQIGAAALAVVTMVYVLIGGMRSVAWTDVIQGLLLLTAMLGAGIAIIIVVGGVPTFFERISAEFPTEKLAFTGINEKWNPWLLMTFCMFASLASVLQPAQWMRFYAARSTAVLRRSAVSFAIILPVCFIFGVMLTGLGAHLLPAESTAGMADSNQVAVHLLGIHLPELFGTTGIVLASVLLVAVLAASMSTADSSLHAMSAIFTRDIYDRFINPAAPQRVRTWVGRGVIIVATLGALAIAHFGRETTFLESLTTYFFIAMAFSCQLLPIAIDMLFIKRGSPIGAILGIIAGVVTILFFTPLPEIVFGANGSKDINSVTDFLRPLLDVGFVGCVTNAYVFALVSTFTRRPRPLALASTEISSSDAAEPATVPVASETAASAPDPKEWIYRTLERSQLGSKSQATHDEIAENPQQAWIHAHLVGLPAFPTLERGSAAESGPGPLDWIHGGLRTIKPRSLTLTKPRSDPDSNVAESEASKLWIHRHLQGVSQLTPDFGESADAASSPWTTENIQTILKRFGSPSFSPECSHDSQFWIKIQKTLNYSHPKTDQ